MRSAIEYRLHAKHDPDAHSIEMEIEEIIIHWFVVRLNAGKSPIAIDTRALDSILKKTKLFCELVFIGTFSVSMR